MKKSIDWDEVMAKSGRNCVVISYVVALFNRPINSLLLLFIGASMWASGRSDQIYEWITNKRNK